MRAMILIKINLAMLFNCKQLNMVDHESFATGFWDIVNGTEFDHLLGRELIKVAL